MWYMEEEVRNFIGEGWGSTGWVSEVQARRKLHSTFKPLVNEYEKMRQCQLALKVKEAAAVAAKVQASEEAKVVVEAARIEEEAKDAVETARIKA